MPLNFTQQERQALLNLLGLGKANAINAHTLAQILGFPMGGTQPRLRKLIKECIEIDQDLIGASTSAPRGFFIIATLLELNAYLDTLEGRIRSDNDRRNALIAKWNSANLHTVKQPLVIT